jgi:endonuclease/exonuclease/phosphatase family metal-dependent hydrolase
MGADIICLQEVQVDLMWPDILSHCSDINYTGVIQNVTRGHAVASAILIRNECPLQIEGLESRSRALIAVLSSKEESSEEKKMFLCNVHLEAGEKDFDNMQRYHQLKSLFKRLSRQIHISREEIKDAKIVMAGDFNMLRTNPLHTFLRQGLLQSPEQIKNLPPASTIKLFDSYLDPTIDGGEIQPRPSRLHFATSEENLSQDGNSILQRTYAMGDVLDYIWHSQSVSIKDTLIFHPLALNREKQRWPCSSHPSDHLPIGVDIEWKP